MITTTSTISFERQAVPPIIQAVQGDTGRNLIISLADMTIQDGSTATVYVAKPSGEAVYNEATIEGDKILIDLTAQMLAEVGEMPFQVRVFYNGEVVTSFSTILKVYPFNGIDAIESKTEMNIFDKAVEQAREEIGTVLDTTLTRQNMAAEAKATGDAIDSTLRAVASAYMDNSQFLYGALRTHDRNLYQATTDSMWGDSQFTPSHWWKTSIGNVLDELVASFGANIYNPTETYEVGDLCMRGRFLKRCIAATTGNYDDTKWETVSLIDLIADNFTFTDPNDDGNIVITKKLTGRS